MPTRKNDAEVDLEPKNTKTAKQSFMDLYNISDEEEVVTEDPLTKVELLKKTRAPDSEGFDILSQ